MKQDKAGKVLSLLFVAILVAGLCMIGLRVGTRYILIRHFGMNNWFTRLVMFDAEKLQTDEKDDDADAVFDYAETYPFYDEDGNIIILERDEGDTEADVTEEEDAEETETVFGEKAFRGYVRLIRSLTDALDAYSSELMPGYKKMAEAAAAYEKVLQWNFAPLSEYNGVMTLDDGYLAWYEGELDENTVTQCAESLIQLNVFCQEQGTELLYIQYPGKISKYTDTAYAGIVDFSNQNADAYLRLIAEKGVVYCDYRDVLYAEGTDHHSLFYRTDHHWKAETGLGAARYILQLLKDGYGFDVDVTALDADRIRTVEYPAWFLGSQGKKVTLAQTEPDDFTLLYPTYDTCLHYEIPDKGIDVTGDFSVTYDMNQVETIDYYGKNPYAAYDHGDKALIRIENELLESDTRILIVHDSFSNCVIPFLALGCRKVDAIDLRHFTGSLETYIEETNPDIVIVAYTTKILNEATEVSITDRTNPYNFR